MYDRLVSFAELHVVDGKGHFEPGLAEKEKTVVAAMKGSWIAGTESWAAWKGSS